MIWLSILHSLSSISDSRCGGGSRFAHQEILSPRSLAAWFPCACTGRRWRLAARPELCGKICCKGGAVPAPDGFCRDGGISAISPDGKSVAFTRDTGGFRQIWVRLLSGGVPIQVTRDPLDHQSPRWSPDSGSLIYYSAPAAEAYGTVWQIPALGGTPRPLTHSLGSADLSHDGKRLAFFRFENRQVELVASALDGSAPRWSLACPPSTTIPILGGLRTTPRSLISAARFFDQISLLCPLKAGNLGPSPTRPS